MTDPGQPPPPSAQSFPAARPYGPPSPFDHTLPYEEPGSTGAERLVFVAICLVAAVVVALPAARLWISLADPPSAKLTDTGLIFGETGFDHITAITLWFVVIGFVFGLVMGLAAALLGRRHGVVMVIAVLLMSWVAASMTAWFGVHLFGPDHPIDFVVLYNGTPKQRTTMLEGFSAGDQLVSSVALTSYIGLVAWPLGAMLGTLIGASLWPRQIKAPNPDPQGSQITAQMPSS